MKFKVFNVILPQKTPKHAKTAGIRHFHIFLLLKTAKKPENPPFFIKNKEMGQGANHQKTTIQYRQIMNIQFNRKNNVLYK